MESPDTPQYYPDGPWVIELEEFVAPVLQFARGREYRLSAGFVAGEPPKGNPRQAQRQYWEQLFSLAHAASLVALMRHFRWHAACRHAIEVDSNYPAFAAYLRALCENAIEIGKTVGCIGLTLAHHHRQIRAAYQGRDEAFRLEPLRECLVWFLRAVNPASDFSEPLTPIDGAMEESFGQVESGESPLREFYRELEHIASPGIFSTRSFMGGNLPFDVSICPGQDDAQSRAFCERHWAAIGFYFQTGAHLPLAALKTLNRFDLPACHTPAVDGTTLEIELWARIDACFRQ